jgi:hypothetical protein
MPRSRSAKRALPSKCPMDTSGKTAPASATVPQPPVQPVGLAPHKWPQIEANNLDFPQCQPAKLDLSLKELDIPRRSRRSDETTQAIMKASKRGLNSKGAIRRHFGSTTNFPHFHPQMLNKQTDI